MTYAQEQERLKKLVNALRSGEFKQGRGKLRRVENGVVEDCCLGVACEVYRRETGDGKWVTDSKETYFAVAGYSSQATLPHAVQLWYGFKSCDPELANSTHPGRAPYPATALNDSYKLSFQEIADAFARTFLEEKPAV